MKALLFLPIFLLIPSQLFCAPSGPGQERARAKQLKEFIRKEKPAYQERETYRQNLAEELDKLNSEQNEIRREMESTLERHKEIGMALENLGVEFKRQTDLEAFEKRRLWLLYKVVYKLKKDGMIRFLFPGTKVKENIGSRMRILFRTLRSRTVFARQLQERMKRLKESEAKLEEARLKNQFLMNEMKEQEGLLGEILKKKRVMLSSVIHKQDAYQLAVKEYRKVSKQLAALFDNFETARDTAQNSPNDALFPRRGTLPLPLDGGQIVRNFGKSINEKFGTVTHFKGVEIQAEMSAPVRSVMAGNIEFEGWVKGLGNVVIIHHGGGFYSLCGHLYRSLKQQGSKVEQGEIVGLVGDTGSSETPSLYFELRENSKAVDPLVYFTPDTLKKFL